MATIRMRKRCALLLDIAKNGPTAPTLGIVIAREVTDLSKPQRVRIRWIEVRAANRRLYN